ncbi:unnamed protein product [Blepharisma stoltei]|uniref:Thioredoxin domain-containing protein n=1 Tax=Blepharisma stoltei TaxID=1481888 RepID=A0AAU9IP83_9CILI|nr:unnamed protein product [Blepharisma stoltei]
MLRALKGTFRFFSTDIKKEAMAAMEEYKTFIYDIDSYTAWLSKVMKSPVPVVLNCYADWSNPCRKLVPIIQKHALEARGKWALANYNIDELPDLMKGLQIKVVPTLILMNGGNYINKLEGMPDEDSLAQFLSDVKMLAGLLTDEDILVSVLEAAKDFLNAKEYDNAVFSYKDALKNEKYREKYEYLIYSNLANAHFLKGELAKAEDYAIKARSKNPDEAKTNKELENILNVVEQTRNNQEYTEVLNKLEEEASADLMNISKQTQIAMVHLNYGYHQKAIDKAIEIIEKEKSLKGEGQKTLLEIVKVLGEKHESIIAARKRLQKLMTKIYV